MGTAALFFVAVLLVLVSRWTDRKGWTRFRGHGRAMTATVLQGWNMAFDPELYRAVEYQKQCHDEEDHDGKKRRRPFPAVAHGDLTVRLLRDTPRDLAALAGWLVSAALPLRYRLSPCFG